jgi:hypothetical protein
MNNGHGTMTKEQQLEQISRLLQIKWWEWLLVAHEPTLEILAKEYGIMINDFKNKDGNLMMDVFQERVGFVLYTKRQELIGAPIPENYNQSPHPYR